MDLNEPLFGLPNPATLPVHYQQAPAINSPYSSSWLYWVNDRLLQAVPGARKKFQHTLKVARLTLHVSVLFFTSCLVYLLFSWLPSLLAVAAVMALLHYAGPLTTVFQTANPNEEGDDYSGKYL